MKIVIDILDYDIEQIKEYYEGHDIVSSTYSYIYHGQPLSEVLDKISAEIKEKAFTEEIFDEDVFRSTFTENMTRETAECESVIETEIVKLSDVLEILEKYKKEGAE